MDQFTIMQHLPISFHQGFKDDQKISKQNKDIVIWFLVLIKWHFRYFNSFFFLFDHSARTIQWIIKQFPHLKIGSRKVIDRGSAPIWHPGFYLKSADNQGNCCQWIQKEISQNGHRGNLRSILSSDYQCNMWLSRNGLVSVEFLYIECKTKYTWMWC